jgi:hypothetical protein
MAKKLKSRRRTKRRIQQQRPRRALDSPDQILNFKRWCQVNDISPRTGFRILASDDGPTVTQLTAKRIGITVAANRAWQQAHARG